MPAPPPWPPAAAPPAPPKHRWARPRALLSGILMVGAVSSPAAAGERPLPRAWAPGPGGGWAVWEGERPLALGPAFRAAPAAFARVPLAAEAARAGQRGRWAGAALVAGGLGLWAGSAVVAVHARPEAGPHLVAWAVPGLVAGLVALLSGGALLAAADGQMAEAVRRYNMEACRGGD